MDDPAVAFFFEMFPDLSRDVIQAEFALCDRDVHLTTKHLIGLSSGATASGSSSETPTTTKKTHISFRTAAHLVNAMVRRPTIRSVEPASGRTGRPSTAQRVNRDGAVVESARSRTPPRRPPPSLEAADERALSTPRSETQSCAALARYLTEPFESQLHKARAVFRWIAENISYNVAGFLSGNLGSCSADEVLRTRVGVCSGYAHLFEAICTEAGLEVVTVSGYAKGVGYDLGQKGFEKTNHAWSVVRIDGDWRLLDSTWGAGHVTGGKMRFVRQLNNHYWITDPEQFILDHLPQDPQWQLCSKRYTMREFLAFPNLKPKFFQQGLQIVSHRSHTIESRDPHVTIEFALDATRPTVFLSHVKKDGAQLNSVTLNQVIGTRVFIHARPPRRGSYDLEIFCKGADEPGSYSFCAAYRIVYKGPVAKATFPQTYAVPAGWTLLGPLESPLRVGRPYRFHVYAPGAHEAKLIDGNDWVTVPAVPEAPGEFALEHPVAGREVKFVLQPNGGMSYSSIARFPAK
eukprot:gnl/Trimastix_PCT/2488.p1 GENE.gnl/Trimastix_PCT/2488~~gnl/Trimastix_PCT/2488.p1  ORF type:complete len:564 (-),score=106.29 gnl/Trimastix_PCT/2488:31-1584(-)